MRKLFVLVVLSMLACKDQPTVKPEATPAAIPDVIVASHKFDKTRWAAKDGRDYPYRDDMVHDLVDSKQLKPLSKDEIVELLGQPDRVDGTYLFYIIHQPRLINWPLHTKALVVQLSQDSTENKVLIYK